jgi:hypothetical protein
MSAGENMVIASKQKIASVPDIFRLKIYCFPEYFLINE